MLCVSPRRCSASRACPGVECGSLYSHDLPRATQLATFLAAQGMPTKVPDMSRQRRRGVCRGHPEPLQAGYATNRYWSLIAFFKFLLDEGEIMQSPLARMQPPHGSGAAAPAAPRS